jgi:hypothetical protein
MHIAVDHLVYATADLERGMWEIEQLTGIAPVLGGRHPGRGTRNALIALGADSYLEIVGPDDDQIPPSTGRWLGVDAVTSSRLTTWAVKTNDVSGVRRRAVANGVPLGEQRYAQRERSDGIWLSWQLTEPDPLVADGVIPFFIDWGASPHPSGSAPHGATLVDIHVEHPDAAHVRRMLDALDLGVAVLEAENAAVVAVIDGPRGRIELR